MINKKIELSPEQKDVLKIDSGKHVIIAPPGSGKTELLVQRLKRELLKGSDPKTIACLTFTNRAAISMQTRVGDVPPDIHIGNFHALSIKLLKKAEIFKAFYTVLDEDDMEHLLDIALDEFFILPEPKDPKNTIDPLIKELETDVDIELAAKFGMAPMGGPAEKRPKSWSKREDLKKCLKKLIVPFIRFHASNEYGFPKKVQLTELKLLKSAMGYPDQEFKQKRPLIWAQVILLTSLKRLAKIYSRVKMRARAFDFDDLIIKTLKWLIDNPKQIQYDWIQVDECQDLNEIQWEILNNITKPNSCLVLFTDPQQAIYSFMGSDLECLRTHCKDLQISTLSRNYRSPSYLLDVFRDFAQYHFKQNLNWSSSIHKDKNRNDLIYVNCSSDFDEQYYLAKRIVPGMLKVTKSNVAILTRSNRLVVEISEALSRNGVSHFIVAQFDLFRLSITKDFMCFLQSIVTPEVKLSWVRLLSCSNSDLSLKESFKIVEDSYDAGLLPQWFLEGHLSDRCNPPKELIHLAMNGRIVIFDTETTGTDPYKDDIIQISAIEISQGIVGKYLNIYLKTKKDIGSSEAIHHISKSTLEVKGIERKKAFEQFINFIGDDPICAHNMRFDLSMIEINLLRVKKEGIFNKNPTYCTLEISRALDPDSPDHKLSTLIKRYAIEGENTHDALDDVKATANLVLALHKKVLTKEEKVNTFYDKHMIKLNNLEERFGVTWRKLRKPNTKNRSFSYLFEIFLNLMGTNFYKEEHIHEIERKLILHMDTTSSPSPVQTILNENFQRYLLYREPDLILESDRVVVSTVHRAKGLEFETVILPSCHSNTYPNYFAKLDKSGKQMKEEKRVLYVALTRAKERVIIVQPRYYTTTNDYSMKTKKSPFIKPEQIFSHFKSIELPTHFQNFHDNCGNHKQSIRSKHSKHQCPKCGRTWPWDGSMQGDDRCFGCGYVPERISKK